MPLAIMTDCIVESVLFLLLMPQDTKQLPVRKSRRNPSHLGPRSERGRNTDTQSEQARFSLATTCKPSSIKINRNKLPADFFDRTRPPRIEAAPTRPSFQALKDYLVEGGRKAESERDCYSPEKTSFFGFFQDEPKKIGSHFYTINARRQFQSRDQPKRQKIYAEHRNQTPMTGTHRAEILQMFPAEHDAAISSTLTGLRRMNQLQISPRKQYKSKIKEYQQAMMPVPDPENVEYSRQASSQFRNLSAGPADDLNNITFFNVKSTSLPPINRNKCSS